jgi:hypothetical protein
MPFSNIDKPSSYFNTKLYTGNGGSSQSITGVGFQPDFVWIKDRPLGFDHNLFDSVRGIYKALNSNQTYVENFGQGSNTDSLTSFDSDGFSLGGDDALNDPYTYVSWNWLAGGTGVSNTSGSISSTVSANTTSGFSIVAYQGTSVAGTIGHGLGVAPKMIIIKRRTAFAEDWLVFHASLGATKNLKLNTTAAEATSSSPFNNTAPTSTVFSVSNDGTTNSSSSTYIAYCFADVKGFSKFGSYTGNGNADGTFVYTGFKPSFLIVKRYNDAGYDWLMYDNKRQVEFNVVDDFLKPNLSDAETTGNANQSLDFLSNGVKFRGSGASSNGSGASYIYMAFAENPFVSSKGIPTTAR